LATQELEKPGLASPTRYDAVAQRIHWVSAALILTLLPLGKVMVWFPDGNLKTAAYSVHVGIGLTVLALTAFRVYWSLSHARPSTPPMPRLKAYAFWGTHLALYFAVLTAGLTGVATLAFSGIVPVPSGFSPQDIHHFALRTVHHLLGYAAAGLFILHFSGVMEYQLRQGNVLARMGVAVPERWRTRDI
jgi:cytochrome b561